MLGKIYLAILCYCCITVALSAETKILFLAGRKPYDRTLEAKQLIESVKGWGNVTVYDNRELTAMSHDLANADVVIFGSLGNFVEPVSFMPYAEQWKQWLESGKTVIILAAGEPSATNQFFKALGISGECFSEQCVMIGRHDLKSQVKFGNHELLYLPYDVASGLHQNKFYNWAHLITNDKWTPLVFCPENKSLAAMRFYGKGMLLVFEYAEFKFKSRLLAEIIQNAMIWNANKNAGFVWKSWNIDMKEHQSSIFFENLQDRTLRFQGCMSIKTDSGKQYAVSFDREVAPRGKFNETLHFDWTPGSSAQSTLVMMNPVKWKASRSVKKTPPISCELPFRRIFKHQAACFPIHIETKIPEKLAGQLTFNVQVEPDVPVKIGELKNGMLHIDWSQCPPGDYKLKMALVYNNGRIFWELPAEKITLDSHLPYNRIDENRRVVRGSKRIFPLGFYHVSWDMPLEDRTEWIRFSAENSYNVIHASWSPREDITSVVEFARQSNILLLLEGADEKRLAQWRNEKTILGWSLIDEPDHVSASPVELKEKYECWRGAAPDHLVYTVLLYPDSSRKYRGIADMVGHDYYPIIQNIKHNVSHFYGSQIKHLAGLTKGSAPIAVIQCFGYQTGFDIPTPSEVRNMVYQAILANTSGILFYTCNDSKFNLRKYPALLDLMKKIPMEIKPLEKFILNGDFSILDTGNSQIIAGRWVLDGEKCEILCNKSSASAEGKINGKAILMNPLEIQINYER